MRGCVRVEIRNQRRADAMAAAQTSIRQTASPVRPRRSDATMNGKRRKDVEDRHEGRDAGEEGNRVRQRRAADDRRRHEGSGIAWDYTPRMRRLAPLLIPVAFIATAGRMDSNLVLYVSPDGHGRAVSDHACYEAGLRAFDSLVPGAFTPTSLSRSCRRRTNGLSQKFGTRVTLASTKFVKTSDGASRTTVVEFTDIRELRVPLPPVLAMGATSHVEVPGLDGESISFAMKAHGAAIGCCSSGSPMGGWRRRPIRR